MTVDPGPGYAATFTVELPGAARDRLAATEPAAEQLAAADSAAAAMPLRVLVVATSRTSFTIWQATLESWGHAVVLGVDGIQR